MELNKHENEMVEDALSSWEERARLWERYGLVVVFIALLAAVYGGYLVWQTFHDAVSIKSESVLRFVEPADAPVHPGRREVWMLDGVRRSLAELEQRSDWQIAAIFETVFGVLLVVSGLVTAVFVSVRRRNGERYRLIVKILRAKWEEEKPDGEEAE